MRIKRAALALLILFLFLDNAYTGEPEKYIPRSQRKQEKLATPEPGTFLKPMALTVLNRINRVMDDTTHTKGPSPWMIDMITPHQKKLVDTLLVYDNLEVPVRIYYPTRKSLQGNQPVILFIHGGGFEYGSVDQYHLMVSKLARVCGQIIVSVEYRLAPGYPYPAALNDCYAAYRWLREFGSGLGADTSRITVMGDSAGGNLATVLTLVCRDRKTPQPFRQILLYPAVTFMEHQFPSMSYFLEESDRVYVLSEPFIRRVRAEYKGNTGQDGDPYISPLEADLGGDLAPALIIAAECDPLRDGDRAYAEKLRSAGAEVHYLEYSGMFHGFMSFHMVIGDALDAMKEIREYLEGN
jgi:acetyl esterase